MIKDILEKVKKKRSPELLIPSQGSCKFCGQITTLEILNDWTDDTCDELATELCECIEASIYARKKKRKEKAREAIKEHFNEIEEENIQLLNIIADMVVEEKIDSGTINIGDGIKAKIAITSKGSVKVEKTKTEKGAKEV